MQELDHGRGRVTEGIGGDPAESCSRCALSILIVAYNSAKYIGDCLTSVFEFTSGDFEVLLIDNGTDGTEDLVLSRFPAVRVIPSRGNIGFGPANNLLAQHARGDRLLLLNPDTKLINPAIDRLLAFSYAQPAGAWGGVTTYPDGTPDTGNFLEIPSIKNIVLAAVAPAMSQKRLVDLKDLSAPRQVSVLCGGFMMMSREAWDAVGGFDPTFLLYSEEVDLFTRLRQAGYEAWITPDSQLIHDVGSGARISATRMRFVYTGRMHYARRHWRSPVVEIVGIAHWVEAARRWLIGAMLGKISAVQSERREAYHPIVMSPLSWWRGYDGRERLD